MGLFSQPINHNVSIEIGIPIQKQTKIPLRCNKIYLIVNWTLIVTQNLSNKRIAYINKSTIL